jgi:nucleoside-diphosphate-sugar epimerase
LVGTLELIEAARAVGTRRFVFISTCAVHERILDDRPLTKPIVFGRRVTTEPTKRPLRSSFTATAWG